MESVGAVSPMELYQKGSLLMGVKKGMEELLNLILLIILDIIRIIDGMDRVSIFIKMGKFRMEIG